MIQYKHYSPRYVQDRLLLAVNERLHPNWPWLTRAMIAFLDEWLRPDDVGLEFGSGRSTVWFASRVGALTSVEDSDDWHREVRSRLEAAGLAGRVTYVHASAAEGAASAYVRVLDRVAEGSLDFALVDGQQRDHCALGVLPKLKPGGLLVIDNCNWYLARPSPSRAPLSRDEAAGDESETWRAFTAATRGWRRYWTTNGVTDTAAWFKPATG